MSKSGQQPPRDTAAPAVPRRVNNFYRRAQAQHRYEPDDHHLMPAPKKPTRLPVDLADAAEVSVQSHTHETNYAATDLPEVSFAGTLVVEALPDEESLISETADTVNDAHSQSHKMPDQDDATSVKVTVVDEPEEAILVKKTLVPFSKKLAQAPVKAERRPRHETASVAGEQSTPAADTATAHIKVHSDEKSLKSKKPKEDAVPLLNPDGVIGMQRQSVVSRNQRSATLAMNAPVSAVAAQDNKWHFVVPVSLAMVVVCMLVLGIESSVVSVNGATVTSYRFSYGHIIDNLHAVAQAAVAYSQNWVR